MFDMKTLAFALVLFCTSSPAAADQVAPPVVRKPAPASVPSPAATDSPAAAPQAACGTAGAAPCVERPAARRSAQDYFAALVASSGASGGDPALDKGLMSAMSQLIAAGRCAEAAALATRSDRAPLAGSARQICRGD